MRIHLCVFIAALAACDGGPGSGGDTDMGTPIIPIGTSENLCDGLIQDKAAHPMTAVAKPAQFQSITDPQFNTTIRRITNVPQQGENPAIRPLYSTVSAWNADETRMILFNIVMGRHELYDGKSYQFVRDLNELNPPDIEQLYWSTTDADILYLVENRDFIAYHVGDARKEKLTTFSFCSTSATGGEDPMFTSFDSHRIGLRCGAEVFIYDIAANMVIARKSLNQNPAQVAPSGTLAFLSDVGDVTDANLNVVRRLDLKEPFGHASMGRWSNGVDYWAGQVFDDGPRGNDDIGTLVVHDLTTARSKVIIGPKTGYPYPPDGHISSMSYKNPGWAFVSTFGNTAGTGLLDLEMLVADTETGTVCRVGRHRSWGKDNTKLQEPYWAEAHTVPSPTGTRATFASDWGNGATVDTYVLELPSYRP
jgi:hypothetical protein